MARRSRWAVAALLIFGFAGTDAMSADDRDNDAAASRSPLSIQAAPGEASQAEIAALWDEARAVEDAVFDDKEDDPIEAAVWLQRASLLFEKVADLEGGATEGYWRASRAEWLAGEFLPLDDVDGKVVRFERSLALADRGLAVNPDSAECMLWKFISMGRLRTTRGVWEGLRSLPDMAALLDDGIALNPTHVDGDDNSTLGNLHYSSAIFYRLVPDWFWVGWMFGVRGDKERALDHSRRALALHPSRLDMQIEVGTQLLCIGTAKKDKARLAEGLAAMKAAVAGARMGTEGQRAATQDDHRELYFANLMIEDPTKACGYSGDKILEMDEKKAKQKS
jgi:hypothetical protein